MESKEHYTACTVMNPDTWQQGIMKFKTGGQKTNGSGVEMKRFLFSVLFLCILLVCIWYPLLALANAGSDSTGITDSLTPEEFGSFAGQVIFVVLVVQFIKLPIDQRIVKVRTEYIVYAVAVIAQILAQGLFYGFYSYTWAYIPKCIAYSFLVAVTAKEVYIKAIGNVEAKKAALHAMEEDAPIENG